jgi:YHS domain-containing protein
MRMTSRRKVMLGAGLMLTLPSLSLGIYPALGDQMPLAIEGYDPVAYFTAGVPTRGTPEFEYEWDEHRYRFVSAEHRDLFKADPARYAPQFAGFCAMALTQGQFLNINPQYWLVSEGRLYLFAMEFGPDRFKRDLARNVSKANQNLPVARH